MADCYICGVAFKGIKTYQQCNVCEGNRVFTTSCGQDCGYWSVEYYPSCKCDLKSKPNDYTKDKYYKTNGYYCANPICKICNHYCKYSRCIECEKEKTKPEDYNGLNYCYDEIGRVWIKLNVCLNCSNYTKDKYCCDDCFKIHSIPQDYNGENYKFCSSRGGWLKLNVCLHCKNLTTNDKYCDTKCHKDGTIPEDYDGENYCFIRSQWIKETPCLSCEKCAKGKIHGYCSKCYNDLKFRFDKKKNKKVKRMQCTLCKKFIDKKVGRKSLCNGCAK